MPAWFLNPALTRFRNEVNSRWPSRDKKSDGTIGDLAHQATNSDHNPDRDGSVDAWDMDNNGVDVNAVIAAAVKHESIAYVIWNRRITSRNQSGGLGTWHPYSGVSPHTEHVHFNTREGYENSTKPWFTEEDDVTPADIEAVAGRTKQLILSDGGIQQLLSRAASIVSGANPAVPGTKQANALHQKLDVLATAIGEINEVDTSALQAQLAAIQASVDDIAALDADAIAAAIPDTLAAEVADLLSARLAA